MREEPVLILKLDMDWRGRIQLTKDVRKALGIKPSDMPCDVRAYVYADRVVLKKEDVL